MEVSPVTVQDVPITKTWVATLDGFVNAEIRAQIQGYLIRQAYREGSPVNKGDLLFEVDSRPSQAALDQAKGAHKQAEGNVRQAEGLLAQSEAQLGKAEQDVKRYTPLVKTSAISQQEYSDAVQSALGAKAGVEAAKAQIDAAKSAVEAAKATVADAQLKLGFTKVRAPIDGVVGIAKGQVGDLVGPASTNPLTTISTLDPIKCYFTVSEQEYLEFNRESSTPAEERANNATFDLILADGSVYPHKGRFFAADRQVDVGTGTIRLALVLANPKHLLRPGQFGRVRSVVRVEKGAILVPQRSVMELQGSYQVTVVTPDNKAHIRPVKVAGRHESLWIIQSGLKPGDRVIVEGTMKVRDGMTVQPTPYTGQADQKQ